MLPIRAADSSNLPCLLNYHSYSFPILFYIYAHPLTYASNVIMDPVIIIIIIITGIFITPLWECLGKNNGLCKPGSFHPHGGQGG